MRKVRLGKSELEISKLIFGSNVLGWTINDRTAFNILDALLDHGINCIDTADIYSYWVPGNEGGESEKLIGKWLKKSRKRSEIILLTKVGKSTNRRKGNLSLNHIFQSINKSLSRMQTDYVDLYQSHIDDQSTPLEETLFAFDSLIKVGKVRFVGASNYSASRFLESLKVSELNKFSRYEVLQPEFNLFDRDKFDKQLQSIAISNQIGVINYCALANGFLSGKYRNKEDCLKSKRGKIVIDRYLNQRGIKILQALDKISKIYQATPSQVALAWQMKYPGISSQIVSVTSTSQLSEIAKSTELALSERDYLFLEQTSKF